MTAELIPNYTDVQKHYDLSDEFFFLFLDPKKVYSCAYFEPAGISLEAAQTGKIDLSLGKLNLSPGDVVLDVGCGWGATIIRAAEQYGVKAIGLTLSKNQAAYTQKLIKERGLSDQVEVRLQGWEEFDEPVDRVVSIGAFEHFRASRYDAFYSRMRHILPEGGRMLLHTIGLRGLGAIRQATRPFVKEDVVFLRFIRDEIFPGGELPLLQHIPKQAAQHGFALDREQSLQQHYAITLDHWAAALREHHDEAVAIASEQTYQTYIRYLTGCADGFRSGFIDVAQFTLVKTPSE